MRKLTNVAGRILVSPDGKLAISPAGKPQAVDGNGAIFTGFRPIAEDWLSPNVKNPNRLRVLFTKQAHKAIHPLPGHGHGVDHGGVGVRDLIVFFLSLIYHS